MDKNKIFVRGSLAALIMALPLWIAGTCFWPFPDHEAVQFIPGTEMVACGEDDLSVSPDNQWLVFSERDPSAIKKVPFNHLEEFQVVSIELESLQIKNHNIPPTLDELPPLQRIGYDAEGSWDNNIFVLKRIGRKYLVIDPEKKALQEVELDPKNLNCSDCPPRSLQPSRLTKGPKISQAYYNGKLGESVYQCRINKIIKVTPGKEKETVVRNWSKRRFLMEMDFRGVRVSPNEKFLAYIFHRGLLDIGPGESGEDHLYLKELETGKEKRIVTRKYFGNLIWNSDSSRLYFSGEKADVIRNDFSGGIYFVDVADVFGE